MMLYSPPCLFHMYRHTFSLLHFALLAPCRYYVFYKLKVCGNPALSKSLGTIFPTALNSLHVFVSHFDNSHGISNFFIIIIFVMVSCDQ